MQRFWVIQPVRKHPIIQLEKAYQGKLYVSHEEAMEALDQLNQQEWENGVKHTLTYGYPYSHEVVALVADWPPSQFNNNV